MFVNISIDNFCVRSLIMIFFKPEKKIPKFDNSHFLFKRNMFLYRKKNCSLSRFFFLQLTHYVFCFNKKKPIISLSKQINHCYFRKRKKKLIYSFKNVCHFYYNNNKKKIYSNNA